MLKILKIYQQKFLLECLYKNYIYANISDLNNKNCIIGDQDKKLNREFYGI